MLNFTTICQDSDYISNAYTVTQDSNQLHDRHTGQQHN